MTKSEFTSYFRKAADKTIEITPKFVTDRLPGRWRFCLNINQTYDHLKPTEKTYPHLAMQEHEYTAPLTESEAINLLWIDNTVPVWIDMNAYRTDNEFTYFDLHACNRFSADKSDYYYEDRGMGPFGIKSPILPSMNWDIEKSRFSLQINVDRFDHLRKQLDTLRPHLD